MSTAMWADLLVSTHDARAVRHQDVGQNISGEWNSDGDWSLAYVKLVSPEEKFFGWIWTICQDVILVLQCALG